MILQCGCKMLSSRVESKIIYAYKKKQFVKYAFP